MLSRQHTFLKTRDCDRMHQKMPLSLHFNCQLSVYKMIIHYLTWSTESASFVSGSSSDLILAMTSNTTSRFSRAICCNTEQSSSVCNARMSTSSGNGLRDCSASCSRRYKNARGPGNIFLAVDFFDETFGDQALDLHAAIIRRFTQFCTDVVHGDRTPVPRGPTTITSPSIRASSFLRSINFASSAPASFEAGLYRLSGASLISCSISDAPLCRQ